jgi:acetoacetyl-CoA synthetase
MRVLFSPDHPVYILYSSGTTGKPKCIVHSAAGTLIQHKKEHVLHVRPKSPLPLTSLPPKPKPNPSIQCDIRPGDRLLYYTTTSWMMWHWLISALSSSATIVLYDGSPFKPHGDLTMPKLIQDLRITQFGTSAKYISILEQNAHFPLKAGLDLSCLRAIYSTGSPLAPSTFRYVYEAFPRDVNLGSITGGTDIISLFGAPCPLSPVYEGEIQVRGLGMAVSAVDHEGKQVKAGEPGDLVCTKPFPSQPVGFWPSTYAEVSVSSANNIFTLPKYDLDKYEASYFTLFPGIWHHGDFVRFNPSTGGMVMLGRSDGILKPAGVRFGSAEIYNVLLSHFGTEIEDSLCIGRRRAGDVDEKVVLFLKMVQGRICDDELKARIASTIRADLSARHVPAIIDECPEIPVTTNGKKIEVAVKQILCGMNIKTSASVANAQCLDWYREWTREHEGVA